jgi:hypothetical protein
MPYHTYPDINEKPIITEAVSTHKPRVDKLGKDWLNINQDIKNRLSLIGPETDAKIDSSKPLPSFSPKMSVLENGLTVVSIETAEMAMSSFSFLIKSGRY